VIVTLQKILFLLIFFRFYMCVYVKLLHISYRISLFFKYLQVWSVRIRRKRLFDVVKKYLFMRRTGAGTYFVAV